MSEIMTIRPGDNIHIPPGGWLGLVSFQTRPGQQGEILVDGQRIAYGSGGPHYLDHKIFHGQKLTVINGEVSVYGNTLSPQTTFGIGIGWGAFVTALVALLIVWLG